MDGTRFDRLARGLAQDLSRTGTRRGVMAGLAALLTGVGVSAEPPADAAPDRAKRRRDDGARRDEPARRDDERRQDAERLDPQRQRGRKRRGCLKDGTRCTAQSGRQGDNCTRCCSRVSVPRTGGGRRCACKTEGAACDQNRQCCSKQCFEGVCLACADTETTCPGAGCVDLQTDDDHCGTCGEACGANETCATGDCVCATGFNRCGGVCVNLQTDDANCGGCGTTCGPNEVCATGDCVCDVGFTGCGGVCVDTETDDANCETCGTVCPATQTCDAGDCVDKPCGAGGPCAVFVTSTRQTAAFGGLSGADAICQGLADDPDAVVPAGIYKAWLSTATVSPSMPDRFYQSPAPYRLPNGNAIASNWGQLTDGAIGAPININEQGVAVPASPAQVWTLTQSDGTTWYDGTEDAGTCVDWSSTAPGLFSAGGEIASVDSRWTLSFIGSNCSNQYRLYCFQQS